MKNVMMVLFVIASAMFLLSGCKVNFDKPYDIGKTVYVKTKTIVIRNWDELPAVVQNKLKKIDNIAIKVDEAHTAYITVKEGVKEELENNSSSE